MPHYQEDTYSIIRIGDGYQHANTFTWKPTIDDIERVLMDQLDVIVNWLKPDAPTTIHLVANARALSLDSDCDENNRLATVLPDGSVLLTPLGMKFLHPTFTSNFEKVTMQ